MTDYRDGEPCAHPGCLSHISHPCEGCGRIGGHSSSGAITCPACGRTTDNRVGVKIGRVWRYVWLCECGERWGWVNEAEDKREGDDDGV